eukprot:TRINITY_DN7772_c0_g1_i1.p1 TRINITY_DN7772_c0_g1~~TRINITY_DN7772_c0_g1_i1.p1  ORF type:complete len:165 (-),score=38.15 TRINITY_DN7772_c0_g1_i1:54-548(-)
MTDGRILKFSLVPPPPSSVTVRSGPHAPAVLPSPKSKRKRRDSVEIDDEIETDEVSGEDDSFSTNSLLKSLPMSTTTTTKNKLQKELFIEEITIDFVKTQLTPSIASRLYRDLVKYLLYTRQQIPLTYNSMENEVLRMQEKRAEEQKVTRITPKQRKYQKVVES